MLQRLFIIRFFFSNEFNESIDKAHEHMVQVIPFIFQSHFGALVSGMIQASNKLLILPVSPSSSPSVNIARPINVRRKGENLWSVL